MSNVESEHKMKDLMAKRARGKCVPSSEGMLDLVAQERFLTICKDDVKQCRGEKKMKTVDAMCIGAVTLLRLSQG